MRASGILMHISSLPSDYGIGTLGKAAYKFADFLKQAGQRYWQILPIGPTSYGDSPYQSFSTNAGNPYFIDLDMLREDGLLEKADYADINWTHTGKNVNYAHLYENRFTVLKKAFARFTPDAAFEKFLTDNEKWVSNYALFMAAKDANGGKAWTEWDDGLKMRDPHTLWEFKNAHADEVTFWEFLQYKFFEQWTALKKYVNDLGIKIIGDIPIYVAMDSAETWVYPDLFELDDDRVPICVAGCPPDDFAPDGQLWGNPIYKWERHRETGYGWWIDRMRAACELYDVVRVDHFRGFAGYYSVPYGDTTAKNGHWNDGPGYELFERVRAELGELPIIAEDLGFLDENVRTLLKQCAFSGMKVLQFGFSPSADSDYIPYNCGKNSVTYIGTHDNPTIRGWIDDTDHKTLMFCRDYIGASDTGDDLARRLIKCALATASDTVIIQMQDWLDLDASARMNTPSTLGGNWQWRAQRGAFSKARANEIAKICKTYGRT